jgi:heme-degrading monooxygenase HmoA
VWALRRFAGDRAEFLVLSLWESVDAIRAFAGQEIEKAVFYPEDDEYLIERGPTVDHYDVIAQR